VRSVVEVVYVQTRCMYEEVRPVAAPSKP
jgi:hypothetical protein